MSEVSLLTRAPRSDVLPGYTLTPFDWSAYGEAEEEFDIAHRRKAGKAAIGLPPEIQDKLIAAASFDGQSGAFAYGTFGFDAKVRSGSGLDFLLWVALKPCHPKITLAEAGRLVTRENKPAVHRAVMECMAYKFDQPKKTEDSGPNGEAGATGNPSPGDSSTEPSVSAA